jgi:hypothetical protein
MLAVFPAATIFFPLVLLVLSLTVSKYISLLLVLYGLWNPKTAWGTLFVLFFLDCVFGTTREIFFGYPGALFLIGVVLLGLFRFIRSRLASHVLS